MTADVEPKQQTLPAVYAILEGGGVKGSALVGGLCEAVSHVRIVGIGGTSAGAIVASLFAAGFTPAEIHELMLELDYSKLAKRMLWPRRFGRHSSEYIYSWMRDTLSTKFGRGPGHRITFSDMPIPLKIVAADIRNRELVVFSPRQYPQMEVALAVRMSMSIPLFYEMITDSSGQFVDGGIVSNFPTWLFDEERLSSANGVSVIGFNLAEPARPASKIRSFKQYTWALIDTVMNANRRLIETIQKGRTHLNIVSIPTGNVSATDFDVKRETIVWLYEQGVSATRTFFRTQSVGSPERLNLGVSRSDWSGLSVSLKSGQVSAEHVTTQICRAHLYKGGVAQDAGTFDRVFIKYYIDLMEAALDPVIIEILAECVAILLDRHNPGAYNIVAGIKMGNPILASAVARRVGRAAILVKNIFTPRGGYPFDGVVKAGDTAIIVDDVASDGTFLLNSVKSLRAQGVRVSRVFTLVNRKEGNAQTLLARDGCSLDSLLWVDDSDLERTALS